MKVRSKKVALGVAALLTVAFGAIGAVSLGNANVVPANAEATVATVDFLGNWTWDKVDGAESYTWWYEVDGTQSARYTATSNEANIGEALTRAAQAAVKANTDDTIDDVENATVKLYVTAGEESAAVEYSHSFTKYIDYGYTSHDISDYNSDVTKPNGYTNSSARTVLTEGGVEFSGASTAMGTSDANARLNSVMNRNELLSFGLTRSIYNTDNAGYLANLYFFGDGSTTTGNYNYQLILYTAKSSWSKTSKGARLVVGGSTSDYSNDFKAYLNEATYATEKLLVSKYYPNYTSNGTKYSYAQDAYLKVGAFDTYDITTGTVVGETFYLTGQYVKNGVLNDMGTIEHYTAGGFTNTTESGLAGMESASCEKSSMYCTGGKSSNFIKSGIVDETAPTHMYYDNVDGSVNWNKVDGATDYQYAIGNNAWTSTNGNNYAIVESYLTDEAYTAIGYLPVRVRAVTAEGYGEVATYNIDLDTFYTARSTAVDYSAVGADYAITKGARFTYSFVYDGTNNVRVGLFGNGADNDSYNVNATASAITLGLTEDEEELSSYKNWRSLGITLTAETRYFVTFGVDEVYTAGQKSAERLTVRVAVADGNDLKTVLYTEYDNTEYETYTGAGSAVEADESVASAVVYGAGSIQLTLDGRIGVYALPSILSGAHRSTLSASLSYNGQTSVDTDLSDNLVTEGNDAGLYKFTQYVAAKDIDEVFSVELLVNGVSVGAYEYSVRNYINAFNTQVEAGVYNETEHGTLIALVGALENYGDAAKDYFNVGEDEAANAWSNDTVSAVENSVFTAAVGSQNNNTTVTDLEGSLLLIDCATIRLYITAASVPTVTVNDVALTVKSNGTAYYVDYKVASNDITTEYTFVINEGQLTVTCSTLFYGSTADAQADSELMDVMKALYLYGTAADAYFDVE